LAVGAPPTNTLACRRSIGLAWRLSENATKAAILTPRLKVAPLTSGFEVQAKSAAGRSQAIASGPCSRNSAKAALSSSEGNSNV
jgi:hypothetical protein